MTGADVFGLLVGLLVCAYLTYALRRAEGGAGLAAGPRRDGEADGTTTARLPHLPRALHGLTEMLPIQWIGYRGYPMWPPRGWWGWLTCPPGGT
jgi:hypothetical protein